MISLSDSASMPRLLAIVGPTAVGKTDLALNIAGRFQSEVIGADSRQVYRYMDIGTAKPTPAQLASTPHHMVDIIDPDDDFSLGQFLSLSKEAIMSANANGKAPLLVGGTGQYATALLDNWNVPLVPPNQSLRLELQAQIESEGIGSLLPRLKDIDPQAAERIDADNPRRVIRAIEVALAGYSSAPRRLAPWFESSVIGLGMERAALYERADSRVDSMMEAGFLKEVERLLAMGYSPDLSSMSGIGYHELADHLLNGTDLPDAVQRIKYRTHRYIRQQFNWFRSDDPRIRWFSPSQMDMAVEFAAKWLEGKAPGR